MLPFDPKKPIYSFKVRAPHAKRRIHLFEDDERVCVLFRPKNAPPDWIGAFFQGSIYYMGIQQSAKRRGRRVETNFRRQVEENLIFRVFHLTDPRENERRTWRILWRPDFAYAIPLGHQKPFGQAFGSFFWPQKPCFNVSLWNTSTFVLRQHFEHEWHSASSDVRAALPWCDLSKMERRWRSIKWLRGGRQELETILRAAYISESHWPKSEVLQVLWFFAFPETKPVSQGAFNTTQGIVRWELSPEHRISRVAERLSERNQGAVDQPNGGRLDWNRNWQKDVPIGTAYDRTNMMIQINPPTQHERLEAALLLRHWLRENAPDLLPDWFPDAV